MPVEEIYAGELKAGDTLYTGARVVSVEDMRENVRVTLAGHSYIGETRHSVEMAWSTRVARRVSGHVVMIGAAL
jgi:hypothetical protein